jgi:hypothetical protein
MLLNPSPLDLLGRPIKEGDAVILQTQLPPVFRIVRMTKVLDPSRSADLWRVDVAITMNFTMRGGQAHTNLMRVATLEEVGPSGMLLMPEGPAPEN